MTIEQKAREIAERSAGLSSLTETPRVIAARLGIIEGRRQAFEEAAKVAEGWKENSGVASRTGMHIAKDIRALIEEEK